MRGPSGVAGVGTLDDGAEFAVEQYEIPEYEHIKAWGLDGPPAFCVLSAMLRKIWGTGGVRLFPEAMMEQIAVADSSF